MTIFAEKAGADGDARLNPRLVGGGDSVRRQGTRVVSSDLRLKPHLTSPSVAFRPDRSFTCYHSISRASYASLGNDGSGLPTELLALGEHAAFEENARRNLD